MNLNTIIDCHTHCNYSDDSHVSPEYVIEQAIKHGLKGLILTDHIDRDYPNKKYNFDFDVPAREKYLRLLQESYRSSIDLLIGIEIGLQRHTIDVSNDIIKNGFFDCVISSVHAVDGYSLCNQSEFFNGKTKKQAFMHYLRDVLWSITHFDDYDVLGHLGYIRRYGDYVDKSMSYAEYQDIVDEILQKIISDGKALEINTSGYDYKLDSPIPDADLVRRYKEMGGEFITIGSDAHGGCQVGRYFDQALDILKIVGFHYVFYYQKRAPIAISID